MSDSEITRRAAIFIGAVAFCFDTEVLRAAGGSGAASGPDPRPFDTILAELSSNSADPRALKGIQEANAHEFVFGDVRESGFSQPNRVKGRSNREISARARSLIISSEVSNRRVYEQKGYDRPTWPGGKSGVTIGFGYDLGQASTDDFRADWQGYLSEDDIASLVRACGKKASAAAAMVGSFAHISVEWDVGRNQFSSKLLPYFTRETEFAFKNSVLLSPDSFGALLDLVYNRGSASYYNPRTMDSDHPDDPRREIRNIKSAMASKSFDVIPNELRSMKRLWSNSPNLRGVVDRREAEAKLFELGL